MDSTTSIKRYGAIVPRNQEQIDAFRELVTAVAKPEPRDIIQAELFPVPTESSALSTPEQPSQVVPTVLPDTPAVQSSTGVHYHITNSFNRVATTADDRPEKSTNNAVYALMAACFVMGLIVVGLLADLARMQYYPQWRQNAEQPYRL